MTSSYHSNLQCKFLISILTYLSTTLSVAITNLILRIQLSFHLSSLQQTYVIAMISNSMVVVTQISH
jgi:hypothetical protein